VAYILKNVQSCTQNGNSVTHALCPAWRRLPKHFVTSKTCEIRVTIWAHKW
jgi:hypothetical protein